MVCQDSNKRQIWLIFHRDLQSHPILKSELNESRLAASGLDRFLKEVSTARKLMKEKGEEHQTSPRVKKVAR